MSLYRDYRPQTFDDVVGQEPIITTLRQAAEAGKLAHAYLLAGTRGTGKTSTARILAKTLLIHNITDEVLRQNIENAVEDGSLVDLVEIDAASNTGVDNIRDLIEKIQFTPVVASAKVYIIDEVHMLSKGAFNALLKTLEEPPAYAYFILATTELHKIPATIQSRCQRFLFKRINEHDIAGRLRFIANKENITAEDDALIAIAHHAEGGLRDAISLLDQLGSLPAITLDAVKERIGETSHDAVEKVFHAIEHGDRMLLINTIHALEEVGTPLETFVRLMLETVRKRLHDHVQNNRQTDHLEPLLTSLLQTIRDLRSSPLPALTVESSLLALLPKNVNHESRVTTTEPNTPNKPNILNQPNTPIAEDPRDKSPAFASELRTGKQDANKEIQEPTKVEVLPPKEVEQGTNNNEQNLLPLLKNKWSEILEGVEPASARMSLKNGRLHDLQNGQLTLAFSSGFHRDKAARSEALHSLEEAIIKTLQIKITVRCVLESEVHGSGVNAEEIDIASAVNDVF